MDFVTVRDWRTYAVVVYVRVVTTVGIVVNLMSAKGIMAPMKVVTIPSKVGIFGKECY